MYSCNVNSVLKHLLGEYSFTLNSEDKYDPDLPLIKSRAHGGTMVLWKTLHDPYIEIYPVVTSAFLPVIFKPPGSIASIHIAIYLPTHGQENEYVEELSKLSVVVEELGEAHPEAPIFMRGDFNVNKNNKKRTELFKHFCTIHSFREVRLPKPTYHHFLGGGRSDSNLDKLLTSDSENNHESLKDIICKLENPLIESHHDIIISAWSVPACDASGKKNDENIEAPIIQNDRCKVLWTEDGISSYESLVAPQLARIQELWSSSCSKTSMSLLLESTNKILNSCAALTNQTIALDQSATVKPVSTPRPVRLSKNALLRQSQHLKKMMSSCPAHPPEKISALKTAYSKARTDHRKLVRMFMARASVKRDQKLFSILSHNPSSLYSSIKRSRISKNRRICKLKVGSKCYANDAVKDGFFDSISNLKTVDTAALESSEHFNDYKDDYHNILELCRHGNPISPISEKDSTILLKQMKPDVSDFYGVTPNHYIHGGHSAWKHFHFLLNKLIANVSNTSVVEVNSVYACILFKAHGKDRNIDKSYRTISTCPVVAKALDIYVRRENITQWNQNKANTQFQGEGSSHELAAVLLTEVIQHSLFSLKKPAYILYLDAMSAFDVALKEPLIRNLFNSGTEGHSLIYLNNRLENRQTFIDWEGNLMGPIMDECGLEQGGVSSSDFYKIYGREQLSTAQESKLGISLGNLTISAIGQADDTALVSNNLHNLQYLLLLTENFCRKYQVKLSSSKTKLQVYFTHHMRKEVNYATLINPIRVNAAKVDFVECAEHVGIERSTSGNSVSIFTRFNAHKRALGAVLHAGLARGHRGNPQAGLRIEQLYGIPVLLSGLAPLVLTKTEENMIEQHHKQIILNIQRLLPRTPRSVVFFLGGSLPGTALLHLRQLSIFGMICRLEDDIIHKHAVNIFTSATIAPKSWFIRIRQLCLQYSLPHPIQLLNHPMKKESYKKLVKSSVINYWELTLRSEAALLSSLNYFKPDYMYLTTPHPLWTTAGLSPSKIAMATVQARMISGKYPTQSLCSKWSNNEKTGICLLSHECAALGLTEDLEHILKTCVALQETRSKLLKFTETYSTNNPTISTILSELCDQSSPDFCQFLLDCSVLPKLQVFDNKKHRTETFNHLFHVTRTWIYSLHKARLKILGRWNSI